MPNLAQQNSYHDTLAQILSQQVLANFDNLAKNLSMEETNEELVLHVRIPKSFLAKDIDKNLIAENKATRSANLFGFMLDKPFHIPDDFDDMYAEEIEALFAGAESSDEHLI